MIKNTLKNKKNSGYVILELLFYISFFAVFSILVINSMIIMTKAFKETTLQAELLQSGSMMERISREIRQAYGIDGTSTSTDLKLNTTDGAGANKTVEFKFTTPNMELWENASKTGNLNTPNIVVTNPVFTQITTTKGTAVKISFTVRSTNDTANRTFDFYDTIVLRGNY